MTDESEDREEALHDAHRSSTNSAVLLAITIAFAAVALADPDRIPSWIVSAWFVIVIPLNLYLLFMYRRRYHHLLETREGVSRGDATVSDDS
ncbi:hypothetical protein [Conyzicola sp.]|uniref:hypothetical protein n=1 Tax=Conyzicola sp. TaxID=1969404 RepID=UPI0039894D10